MFERVGPGEYGEFEIIEKNSLGHSKNTFRTVYEYVVRHEGSEFRFNENESYCTLVQASNSSKVEAYLAYKYLLQWGFPVKSGLPQLVSKLTRPSAMLIDGSYSIPDINISLEMDLEGEDSFYFLNTDKK